VFVLIGEMDVNPAHHVQRGVAHERGDGCYIHAAEHGVRAERVTKQVKAYVVGEVERFVPLQALYALLDSGVGPRL
jgi:hypothetical protein